MNKLILYGLRHKVTKMPLAVIATYDTTEDSDEVVYQFDEYFPGGAIWLVDNKDKISKASENTIWMSHDYNRPSWPNNLKPENYEIFIMESK